MAEGQPSTTTIVTPFTLANFARALRELIGLFREAAGIGRDGADLLRRRRAGAAASDLDSIAFPPRGFCRSLQRIATGQGTDADVDELERRLKATAEEVADRVQGLRRYKPVVREQCGAAAGRKLIDLMDGPDGKFVIRYEIEGLISTWRGGRSTKADNEQQAAKVLAMISSFNDKLIELHDVIFPPRGAPR